MLSPSMSSAIFFDLSFHICKKYMHNIMIGISSSLFHFVLRSASLIESGKKCSSSSSLTLVLIKFALSDITVGRLGEEDTKQSSLSNIF